MLLLPAFYRGVAVRLLPSRAAGSTWAGCPDKRYADRRSDSRYLCLSSEWNAKLSAASVANRLTIIPNMFHLLTGVLSLTNKYAASACCYSCCASAAAISALNLFASQASNYIGGQKTERGSGGRYG